MKWLGILLVETIAGLGSKYRLPLRVVLVKLTEPKRLVKRSVAPVGADAAAGLSVPMG